MLRLGVQIEELSLRYIQNLNDDGTFIPLSEAELDGLPKEFFESLDKNENGQFKVTMRSHHTAAILEHCKVGTTRRMVAMTYGKRFICATNLLAYKAIQTTQTMLFIIEWQGHPLRYLNSWRASLTV